MTNQKVVNGTLGSYPVAVRSLADTGEVQLVQLDIGTGTTSSPVTAANPVPITGAITVSGTVSVSAFSAGAVVGVDQSVPGYSNRVNIGDSGAVSASIDSSSHGETNLVAADLLVGGQKILPGQQIGANSIPVVIANDQLPGADRTAQGALRAVGDILLINCQGCGSVAIQSFGTFSATATTEASLDGITWSVVLAWSDLNTNSATTFSTSGAMLRVPVAGYSFLRVRCTAFTSGTLTVRMEASASTNVVAISSAFPTGTNSIGAVTVLSQLVDNAAWTDGTSSNLTAGYVVDEVAGAVPLSENDVGAARMTINRAQVVTIEDSATRGQRLAINTQGQMQVSNDELRRIVEIQFLTIQAQQYEQMYASGPGGGNYGFEVR